MNKQQSSTLVMALAIIASTMLISSVLFLNRTFAQSSLQSSTEAYFIYPVIDGPNTVNAEEEVTLDGSESYYIVTIDDISYPPTSVNQYFWNQISGPSVDLADPNADTVTFIAPSIDEEITLKFELTVTADNGQSSTVKEIAVKPISSDGDVPALPTGGSGDVPALPTGGSGDVPALPTDVTQFLENIFNKGKKTIGGLVSIDGISDNNLLLSLGLMFIGGIAVLISAIALSRTRRRHYHDLPLTSDNNKIQYTSEYVINVITEGGIE